MKNIRDLVKSMDGVVIGENEILVSYNVKSLFSSVLARESIKICERKFGEDNTLEERSNGMDVNTIIRL